MVGLFGSRAVARLVAAIAFAALLMAVPPQARAGSDRLNTRSALDSVLFDSDAGAWRTGIRIGTPRKAPVQPARFFTITNVLAGNLAPGPEAKVASLDSKLKSDAPGIGVRADSTNEPFGLVLFRAPEGTVWSKWRDLENEMKAEIESIDSCRIDSESCSLEAARFVSLTERALSADGAARIQAVNSAINESIRYQSDLEHHGMIDKWSAPLATLKSGTGDCEDYAIAKYVALRQLGIPAANLKVLLVRDTFSNQDHAVLAVRRDASWLLLDNRWSQMIESSASPRLMPLFALGEDGVKLFASRYADNQTRSDEFDPAPASDETGACAECSWPTPFLP
jgi:predicted transglutaminase-like cysteine proteinase